MATTNKFIRFSSKSGIYYCHSITDYTGTIQSSYRTVWQIHTACEIFMLLKGSVTYVIEGNSYKIKPGELVLVPPLTNHFTIVDTSVSYERIALEFSPDLLPALFELDLLSPFKNAKLFFHTVPASDAKNFDLEADLKSFGEETLRKDKFRDVDLVQRIVDFSKKLIKIEEELSQHTAATAVEKTKVSQLCIAYINANIEKNLTVEMIAEAIHVSPSHILHQFKKEAGKTIHQYITHQKMQAARSLLKQGNTPVAVAAQLGYDYYSTFYNNFLKIVGIPPSEDYRQPGAAAQTNTVQDETSCK